MKLIDEFRTYLAGSKVAPAGKPFEIEDEGVARAMLENNPTLREWSEDEPEPKELARAEVPEPDPTTPVSEAAPEQPEQKQSEAAAVAVYKGGGWYDLAGKSVRLADVPQDVKIVRE
jgi:hypothetical protein